MTEKHKWMILLFPGTIQKTPEKKIVYPLGPFFSPHSQKVLNFGFPGRRKCLGSGLGEGALFPFSYHT